MLFMNTNMEINPTDTIKKEDITPIELQALLAEQSAAEQAVTQKEQELMIAKQKLEDINSRITKSRETVVENKIPETIEAYTHTEVSQNLETPIVSPTQESENTPVVKSENMFSVGEERYEMIASKISSVKENVKSRVSGMGNKLGNFFRKIKDFGYEIPKNISVAILSTDKIIESGLNMGTKGLDAGIAFVDKISDKAANAVENNAVGVSSWINEKAQATKKFAEEKAVLTASIVAYKAERTKEGLARIQDSIFNQFNKLNNFMTEAGNFASAEVRRIKMRLKDEIIAYKMRELDKEIARDAMVANNLEDAKQARLNAIKDKANKLISLRDGLNKVAITNNSQVAI